MNKLNVTVLAALVSVLDTASAQQVSPNISSRSPARLVGGGPPPTLVAPAANFQLATQATRSTPALFRWNAPAGGPTPQRYVLCIAEQGVSCSTSQAAIYQVGTVTQYQAQVPPRFHEKALQWTVAACGPGYGGLAAAGSTNTDCSWAAPRQLYAGYQPPLINLLSPAPQAAVSKKQRFTWQQPQAQPVESFQLCIADNPAECSQPPSSSNYSRRIDVPAGRTFADVDFQFLGWQQQRHWTVLSCRQGQCRLAANQPIRPFKVPALDLPGPADIQITITDVRVRNRCDSVSPGDWALRLGAWEALNHTTRQDAKANWPNSGSHNVSDREWVRLNHTLHLKRVDWDSSLGASVSAVDCDADGIWTPFRLFQGTEGIAAIISDWQAHCGGEEVWEASGHNDIVGHAILRIPPEEWHGANRKRFSAVSEDSEACGRASFTAHFEVTSSE